MSKMRRKTPKVQVRDSMFGEFTEEQLSNPNSSYFFLPGYSDRKTQAETEFREYQQGKRTNRPVTMPYRIQFVATERPNGQPDNRKRAEFMQKGYVPLSWEDATARGIDVEKSAAHKGTDGNLYIGEQMAMVCSPEVAAREYGRVVKAGEDQIESIEARLRQTASAFNASQHLHGDGGTEFQGFADETGQDDSE